MRERGQAIICGKKWYRRIVRIAVLIIFALCLAAFFIGYIEARPQTIAQIQKTEVIKVETVEVVEVIKEVEVEADAGEWKKFIVTAYTSHDEGVGEVSAIGLNIARWNGYFGFCAVDPDLIAYGSVVLVEFEDGKLKPFLAVDCGHAIKGKRLDLYFGYQQQKAFDFGVQKLRVKVIK